MRRQDEEESQIIELDTNTLQNSSQHVQRQKQRITGLVQDAMSAIEAGNSKHNQKN